MAELTPEQLEENRLYFLELQFTHLKNREIIKPEVTFDQYVEEHTPIWPPQTPAPTNDRH